MTGNGLCVVVAVKGMEQPPKSFQSLYMQKEVAFMDWSVLGHYVVQIAAEHKLLEMGVCTLSGSLLAPFIKRWGVTFWLAWMLLNIWCPLKLVQSASCNLKNTCGFFNMHRFQEGIWGFYCAIIACTSAGVKPLPFKDLQAILAMPS